MDAQLRIALAGGGGAADSRLLDQHFASWLGPGGHLLYWPVALRGRSSFPACLDWITATLAPFKITHITMWTDLASHLAGELDAFDALYIGGGNTFNLLAELRTSGFDRHLVAFARRGAAVYGGSAGAVVLGRDIQTVNHMDRNEVGLRQTHGLDLLDGHSVWVHYRPQDDSLIEAHLRRHPEPVLTISERSGIVVEDGRLRGLGFEQALRFDARGRSEI